MNRGRASEGGAIGPDDAPGTGPGTGPVALGRRVSTQGAARHITVARPWPQSHPPPLALPLALLSPPTPHPPPRTPNRAG